MTRGALGDMVTDMVTVIGPGMLCAFATGGIAVRLGWVDWAVVAVELVAFACGAGLGILYSLHRMELDYRRAAAAAMHDREVRRREMAHEDAFWQYLQQQGWWHYDYGLPGEKTQRDDGMTAEQMYGSTAERTNGMTVERDDSA